MEKRIYENMIADCQKNIGVLNSIEPDFVDVYLDLLERLIKLDLSEEQQSVVFPEMYKLSIFGIEVLPDPRVEERQKNYVLKQLFENSDVDRISDDINELQKINNLLLNSINTHINRFQYENVIF